MILKLLKWTKKKPKNCENNRADDPIDNLKLTFIAERPPPQSVQQELLMAAEESGEYF